jgi:lipopolysaccharide transport system permease protein
MSYLKDVLGAKELLVNLVLREVSGKYRRTALGQLWSLANPIAAIIIYSFVFSVIFQLRAPVGLQSGLTNYALFLVAALLPWLFFQRVLSIGVDSIVDNAGLVQKVYFPRLVLPLSVVGASFVTWLFEMGVLIAALLIVGAWGVVPLLPVVVGFMILFALFAGGLSMVLAIVNVYFRDTAHFVTLLLQFWFYLTPILYPVSLVQGQSDRIGGLLDTPITLLHLYKLNPMEPFVSIFRSLLYDNVLPEAMPVIIASIWTLVFLVVGYLLFWRKEKMLAELL